MCAFAEFSRLVYGDHYIVISARSSRNGIERDRGIVRKLRRL